MKQIEKPSPPESPTTIPGPDTPDSNGTTDSSAIKKATDKNVTPKADIQAADARSPGSQIKHNLTTKENLKNTAESTAEKKQLPKIIPPQPVAKRGRKALRGQNKFYDRKNPEYKTLQKANHALAGFPADTEGQVNWVLALDRGMIKPRTTRRGNRPMEILESDIIMKNTREMAYVRFPHKAHTEWLACKNCHESIFIEKKAANDINMTKIFEGEYCGACHDKVAFSSFVCDRCHSIPNTDEQ